MRKAVIKYNNIEAGMLRELDTGEYEFTLVQQRVF
jgi:hypothetical protein